MRTPARGTTVFAHARVVDPSRGLDERGTVIVTGLAGTGMVATGSSGSAAASGTEHASRPIMPIHAARPRRWRRASWRLRHATHGHGALRRFLLMGRAR